jgi:hypothetical protein
MSELEELKKRIAALEKAAKPPEPKPAEPFVSNYRPRDWTEGMSMPANARAAMMAAVPEGLMSALRADARLPNPVTSPASMIPAANEPSQIKRGRGWVASTPLGPPAGIERVDEICKAQDRIDKTELAMKMAKSEAALKGGGK